MTPEVLWECTERTPQSQGWEGSQRGLSGEVAFNLRPEECAGISRA